MERMAELGTRPASTSAASHGRSPPVSPARRWSSDALAQNSPMPMGIMSTPANRTMPFSEFMISELTFLTYLAWALILAT